MQLPLVLTSSFPPFCSLRICLRIRIYVQLRFSFIFPMGGAKNICKSRDFLSLVSASPIHNSKGRAFSCTVALELSNPPFSNAGLRKIFLSNWKTIELFVLRQNDFLFVKKIFFVCSISCRRGRRHRVTPGPRLSVKVTS